MSETSSPLPTPAPKQPPPSNSHDSAPARRRTGKVARLPKEDRDLVNLMLHDGVSYPDICKKLSERGHQLNPDNLCHWRAGGHQDWLAEQAWLEEMRVRLDFATDIVEQKNGDLLDAASLRIAVVQMYNLLAGFNPARLSDKLAEQPGAYARILNVLCKLTQGAVKLETRRSERNNITTNTPAKDPTLSLLASALSTVKAAPGIEVTRTKSTSIAPNRPSK